jgi:hypothetical protein
MADSDAYLADLQGLIVATFSRAELADLCLRLGINFDSLPDAGLAEQARELILALARRERLPELLAGLRAARPHVAWPPVPPGYRPPAAAAPAGGFSIGSVNAGNLIVGNDAVMNVSQGARYELSGDFRGAIVNIESTLRDTQQTIEALPAPDDARAELIRLVGQLERALRAAPPGWEEEAAEVADLTQALVDAAGAEKPKKPAIRALGEGLKEAAEALRDDLPAVVEIAARIAAAVASLPGAK